MKLLWVINILMAVGLYGVNTNFTILLFTAGFSGWEQVVRFAFAVFFEGSKIGLWVEGIARKSILLVTLSVFFSFGSLTTATLGMISSELSQVAESKEAIGAENLGVDQAEASVARIEAELEIEQGRLAAGSALYRTDARETRARIDQLKLELREAQQAVRDAVAARNLARANAKTVTTNPLAAFSQRLGPQAQSARLAFGFYQALMLELGGLATSALAIRKKREAAIPEPEAEADTEVEDAEIEAGIEQLSPVERLARVCFNPKARNNAFPSFRRVSRFVSRSEYDAIVDRGILAFVLRRSHGSVYVSPDVTEQSFIESITAWPG